MVLLIWVRLAALLRGRLGRKPSPLALRKEVPLRGTFHKLSFGELGALTDTGGNSMRMALAALSAVLFTCSLATTAAQAQSPADAYPNKPIRIVVPFAPGGIVDTSARVIGNELSKRWGQQVV